MSRLSPIVFASLLAGCASAATIAPTPSNELPLKLAPRPTEGAITPADLMTRLYIFADDSMMGREAGTLGNVMATNYIAREMERMGLRPAGEDGGWFQTVPAVISRVETLHPLTVDGVPLAFETDLVPFHAASGGRALPIGSTTRSLAGARAVFGGELGGTLISPADGAGKVVVFTVPTRADGTRDWHFYQLAPLTAYASAAGIAVVTLDVTPRSTINRQRGGLTHISGPQDAGTAPFVMLVSPAAAVRMLGASSLAQLQVGALGRTIAGNLEWTDTPVRYPPRNVIGMLPGSDPALRGEFVAVGAHNDHIGLERRPLDHDSVDAFNRVVRRQGVQDSLVIPTGEQWARINRLRDSLTRAHGGVRPDSVNNGADDDGSGTVAMLEIAERFATAAERPKRSLLFVSHTGEEKGLWGSEWFTDHPTVPRDSIVAQLNMDMVGRGKATDIMGRGPNNVQMIGARRLSTQLGDLIDSVNASRAIHMDIDPSFDANGHPLNRYCRSDHYMYARYGIPITYFSLGYHTGYHQVIDEPQEIDYEHMARIAGFVHDIAEVIANRPTRLVVDKPKPSLIGGCRQ
ncbi:MAG: peptidase [Gemmatimonadetes bacterium]|nr:peptidase [Gemmatimonadota bacterium]